MCSDVERSGLTLICCAFCGLSFASQEGLGLHLRQAHVRQGFDNSKMCDPKPGFERSIWVSKPNNASFPDSAFLAKHSGSVADPDPDTPISETVYLS